MISPIKSGNINSVVPGVMNLRVTQDDKMDNSNFKSFPNNKAARQHHAARRLRFLSLLLPCSRPISNPSKKIKIMCTFYSLSRYTSTRETDTSPLVNLVAVSLHSSEPGIFQICPTVRSDPWPRR